MMRRREEESGETVEEGVNANNKVFLLLVTGFALVFVGIVVVVIATVLFSGGSASAGAVVFIGPFPIVIGAGPDVTWIVLFSIIIAVLSVVMFFIMNRR